MITMMSTGATIIHGGRLFHGTIAGLFRALALAKMPVGPAHQHVVQDTEEEHPRQHDGPVDPLVDVRLVLVHAGKNVDPANGASAGNRKRLPLERVEQAAFSGPG